MKFIRLYLVILRTFGLRLRPLATFALLCLQRSLDAATRALDLIMYRQFRHQRLDRPVFILGHPRSGTTFMHRFLLHTEVLCAFELWEMLFPAITARKVLRRMVHRLARFSPGRFHSGEAHEAGVRDVETDDAMAFFHFVDGGFLWSYFWAWQDRWGSPLSRRVFVERGEKSQPRQNALFSFLERAWRRNLVYKNKPRIVVKSSLMSLRPEELVARYPDCKILYLVRDPLEAIPSGMSLLTDVLDRSYQIHTAVPQAKREQYLENLYQASLCMYSAFHEAWQAGRIPQRNLHIVRYDQLTGNLRETMSNILDFLEIEPSAEFSAKVAQEHDIQQQRRSKHSYSLETFQLSPERIAQDLDFVYRDYGLPRPTPREGTVQD